jgi:hypothetical protein
LGAFVANLARDWAPSRDPHGLATVATFVAHTGHIESQPMLNVGGALGYRDAGPLAWAVL